MTKPLEIQTYLRAMQPVCGATLFEQLEKDYAITAKQHSKYPNLWLFKYNQIESDFSKRIVQECRGIILDQANNWAVRAMPFTKFFSYGESLAAKINWSSARVQEKLDGSMITTYYYGGKWCVATSGCPDGLNKIGDFDKTFEDLFWECFSNQNLLMRDLCPSHTYMWELTSPLNRVVVDHKESKITVIGARSNLSLEEVPWGCIAESLPRVVEYPIKTLEECLDAANNLNPLEHEGYVVVDQDWNRIKVKSIKYLSLHHLRDHCSLGRLAEVIRAGEYSEFSTALDSYPEIKTKFLEMVKEYELLVDTCFYMYGKLCDIKEQKDFAREALETPYSSVLFSMRKTGKSPRTIIKEMNANAYLRLMGIKE